MIEVLGLTKKYGERTAINQLNFKIEKGDVVGLLGPNGAGKSTTMKILTGFMSPTSGRALIAGFDVFENPIEVKKRIGYLPETPPLYQDMYVEDYLRYVSQLKMVPVEKAKALIEKALVKTQLLSVRHRLIRNLSKGFKQRVGIAQALVSDPEVLILDEPTVGLDPKQVSEVRELIKELRGSHTIIISTHILSEVQAICNKAIIIHQGQIVTQDTIENLEKLNSNAGIVYLELKRTPENLNPIQKMNHFIKITEVDRNKYEIHFQSDVDIVESVAAVVLNEKWGLVEIRSQKNQLEDIFLKLTYGQTDTNQKVGIV